MTVWTLDHHGGDRNRRVQVGDVLVNNASAYRVTAMREVESRVWPDRWRLTLDRVASRDGRPMPVWAHHAASKVTEPDGQVIWTNSYRRGEGPRDRHCGLDGCEGCR